MEDPFKMIPIDDILNTYYKDMNRYINAQCCFGGTPPPVRSHLTHHCFPHHEHEHNNQMRKTIMFAD